MMVAAPCDIQLKLENRLLFRGFDNDSYEPWQPQAMTMMATTMMTKDIIWWKSSNDVKWV